MAKGIKTGGRPFEKGNPFRRPKVPEEIKEMRKQSLTNLISDIILVQDLLRKDKSLIDKSQLTMMQEIIYDAYIKKDKKFIEYLHARAYGKPTESHRLVDDEGKDRDVTINISNDFLPSINGNKPKPDSQS